MLKAPALFLVLRTEPAAGRTIQPGTFADELLLVGSCPDSTRREADGSANARPYLARFVE